MVTPGVWANIMNLLPFRGRCSAFTDLMFCIPDWYLYGSYHLFLISLSPEPLLADEPEVSSALAMLWLQLRYAGVVVLASRRSIVQKAALMMPGPASRRSAAFSSLRHSSSYALDDSDSSSLESYRRRAWWPWRRARVLAGRNLRMVARQEAGALARYHAHSLYQ